MRPLHAHRFYAHMRMRADCVSHKTVDFGVERSVAVEGLDAAAVGKELENLTSSAK